MTTCFATSLVNGLRAAEVTFAGPTVRPVTAEEVADEGGPSPKSRVYDFFLSSDADILWLSNFELSWPLGNPTLYNNDVGMILSPPNPLFVEVFPSLAADSWVTTPGHTKTDPCVDTDCLLRWIDDTDDGPQSDFHFARMTSASPFVFEGLVTVAGPTGPEAFPFAFSIVPEPSAFLLVSSSLTGTLIHRRRH